ncbi:MAG: nucleotidyltransferase family protein, partial [Frankia sp.]
AGPGAAGPGAGGPGGSGPGGSGPVAAGPATVRAVVADDWSSGIAASLRAGLAAFDGEPDVTAVVVALADQPLIGSAAVARLIAARGAGTSAAVATYGGAARNPVLLERSVWSDVAAAAHGDLGARVWLRAHPTLVTAVDCDGTGLPDDVDTPADLARVVELLNED